jgi:hypothetical protein
MGHQENILRFRVLKFGHYFGRLPEEFQQSFPRRPFCPTFGEFSCCLHHTYFFRNGHSDPLIQGDTIFLRQPLRGFLGRERQLQRIRRFTHRFTIFSRSAGRSTGILNRSPAAAKSARSYSSRQSSQKPPLCKNSKRWAPLGLKQGTEFRPGFELVLTSWNSRSV